MVPFLTGWRAAPVWWFGDGTDWVVRLRAHGPFQVLGFCVLFTMGVAYQMLGELLNARQSPARLAACLWLMLIGILGQAFTSLPWFLWLQLGSGLLFVSSVAGHRPAASVARQA